MSEDGIKNGELVDYGEKALFTKKKIEYEIPDGVISVVQSTSEKVSVTYKIGSRSGSCSCPDEIDISKHRTLSEIDEELRKHFKVSLLSVLERIQGRTGIIRVLSEREDQYGFDFNPEEARGLESRLPN